MNITDIRSDADSTLLTVPAVADIAEAAQFQAACEDAGELYDKARRAYVAAVFAYKEAHFDARRRRELVSHEPRLRRWMKYLRPRRYARAVADATRAAAMVHRDSQTVDGLWQQALDAAEPVREAWGAWPVEVRERCLLMVGELSDDEKSRLTSKVYIATRTYPDLLLDGVPTLRDLAEAAEDVLNFTALTITGSALQKRTFRFVSGEAGWDANVTQVHLASVTIQERVVTFDGQPIEVDDAQWVSRLRTAQANTTVHAD